MKNLKELYRDHKKEILLVSCGLTGVAIAIAGNQLRKRYVLVDLAEKSVITWKPDNKFVNLETVKRVLELNKDNTSVFAVVKEGPIDAYTLIRLRRMV
jgi:hypothetical protein